MNQFILVALVIVLTGYSGTQANVFSAEYRKAVSDLSQSLSGDDKACKTADCEKTSGNVCVRFVGGMSGCVPKASCDSLAKLADNDDVVYCGATNVAVNAVVMLFAAVGAMLYTRLQ